MAKLLHLKSMVFVFTMTISIAVFSQKPAKFVEKKQSITENVFDLNHPKTNYNTTIINYTKPESNSQSNYTKSNERDLEILVSEDFSLFVLGTEDEPDSSTPLAGADMYIDPAYTQQEGWSGYAVYQAGQTCAITDAMGGMLNTPEREMSGTITVSFRIKLLPEVSVDQTTMYVTLATGGIWNAYPVDFDAAFFTHDWTELSFTFENPESADCFIQFKAFQKHIIDDILVTRELTFIPAPNALDATDYTMEGFTTTWNTVYSADNYLLSVFRKNVVGTDSVHVLEGFDGINNDGTFIDDNDPNYPEGWTINLEAGDTREVITGDGNYISSPQALCMDAIGDSIILPSNGGRFSTITVNFKLVEYNGESGTIDYFVKRNGEWSSYAFTYLSGIYENAGMDWVNIELLWTPNKYEDMAIVFNSSGNAVVAIDDIQYTTSPPTETEYMLEDFSVADTSYVVTDLDPAFDYYYYVKSQNSEFTSISSNWVKVFGLAAPNILDASNITDDSYQANWESHPKADYYEIHNYDVYIAPEDEENYVVLSENFDLVQNGGTVDNPIVDPNFDRKRLDEYTNYPDWFGTSTIYADGMIGAGYSEYIWGGITSPEMSLSNDTTFHVRTRIYCTEGETVVLFSSVDRHEVTFTETGFQNIELDFTTGENSDRERLRIYTSHAYNFFIDFITVTQNISKDDKVYTMLSWDEITGGENENYVFTNLWFEEDHDFAFDIYAIHNAFGTDYWSVISERRDMSTITNINELADSEYSIFPNPANQQIEVSCSNLIEISIYNMYGQQIALSTQSKINTAEFESGIYIVRVTTTDGLTGNKKIIITH